MTSDAKIGLLLGLVFIFIIAFVINGLPRFRNALENNEISATQDLVQSDPIGARERNVPGVFEQPLSEEIAKSHIPNDDNGTELAYRTPSWSDDNSGMQSEHADQSHYPPFYYTQNTSSEQASDYVAPAPETSKLNDSAVSNDTELQDNIRFQGQFAFNNNNQNEGGFPQLASNMQDQPRVPAGTGQDYRWNGNRSYNGSGQGGFGGQWMSRRGGLQGQPQQPLQTSLHIPSVEQKLPGRQVQPGGTQSQQNQSDQGIWPKTYVIQDGDSNLAKIARKFYGEEEGNRIVNVKGIFEANKDAIKSADKIFVGQKIVIPSPAPAENPKPAYVLKGTMFQSAASVGGRTENVRPAIANVQDTGGRLYEVKADDSLWKIAAEQLGKGTRFNEIGKLNADILSNKNKLKPGMKLLLPAK